MGVEPRTGPSAAPPPVIRSWRAAPRGRVGPRAAPPAVALVLLALTACGAARGPASSPAPGVGVQRATVTVGPPPKQGTRP